jgi:hypothetical protein
MISSVAGRDMSTTYAGYAVFTGRVCDAPRLEQEVPLKERRDQVMNALYGIGTPSGVDKDDDLLMPPDQPLASSEIDLIELWYDAGAPCD